MGDLLKSEPAEKTGTATTEAKLTSEQQGLIDLAMPTFEQFGLNPPSVYQGPTVAEFDPSQTTGQNQVLGAVPAQQQIASDALSTSGFLSNDVLYPGTNLALAQHAEEAVKPLYQNLTEAVLPAVRGGAYTTGGFGGSRQGIAEGLASGRTAQAAGATTADIYNEAYKTGLDAMVKGAALTPTFQAAQTQPGVTTSGVGDVRQAREQALLDTLASNYYAEQWTPYLMAKDFAAISAGLPGGKTVTNQTGTAEGGQQSPVSTAIGAAATLLPLFFSDRRLKKDIEVIGKLFDGTPVYRFRYKTGGFLQIGFMADEVMKDAVIELSSGMQGVNYEMATDLSAKMGKEKGE